MKPSTLNVGLIGYGYWGPNLARNFNMHPECKLTSVADLDTKRRALAERAYPNIKTSDNPAEIAQADDVDIVVIATPVRLHFELAKIALLAGKHVWVEKPITASSAEALELTKLAQDKGLTLIVDHTFLFTGAVSKMKELIEADELGELYYYDSVRVNLGLFQSDVNVAWDLATHDLSIMDYLLGPSARAVCAQGRAHFGSQFEDVAYLTVYYDNNLIAHFHVNWLSPVKLRHTIVGGSKKMLLWDDLSADEKLKIYSKGVELKSDEERQRFLAEYRIGDMYCPKLDATEALTRQVAYFIECIHSGNRPHNDGAAGARIVSLLEASDRSLKNNGALIEL